MINWITIYFGNPSGVLPNSCVLLDGANIRVDQQPTIWGYDSGITQSINPISISAELRFVSQLVQPATAALFRFVNTSTSAANVDVTIAGWLIDGTPLHPWLETVLNGP